MKTDPEIPPILLDLHNWNEVTRVLKKCVPEYTVWAFGSRVSGTHKTYSDLDLVILANKPLTLEQMATINDAFDEADLTIRVDIVDWAATHASFKNIILQNYIVVQVGTVNSSDN